MNEPVPYACGVCGHALKAIRTAKAGLVIFERDAGGTDRSLPDRRCPKCRCQFPDASLDTVREQSVRVP